MTFDSPVFVLCLFANELWASPKGGQQIIALVHIPNRREKKWMIMWCMQRGGGQLTTTFASKLQARCTGALGQLPPKVGFLGLVWVQSNSAPVGQKWVRECPLGVLPLAMCLCYVEIRNNLWLVSRPGMPNIWVTGQTRSVTGAQSGPCTCLVKLI